MFSNNRFNQLLWSAGMAIAMIASFSSPGLAQAGTDDQGYQSSEKNGIYGDAPSGLNPLDIMHRAQQMNRRSSEEFNEESQAQINNSVSDFKRLQQQRILQQQQSATQVEAEAIEIEE